MIFTHHITVKANTFNHSSPQRYMSNWIFLSRNSFQNKQRNQPRPKPNLNNKDGSRQPKKQYTPKNIHVLPQLLAQWLLPLEKHVEKCGTVLLSGFVKACVGLLETPGNTIEQQTRQTIAHTHTHPSNTAEQQASCTGPTSNKHALPQSPVLKKITGCIKLNSGVQKPAPASLEEKNSPGSVSD